MEFASMALAVVLVSQLPSGGSTPPPTYRAEPQPQRRGEAVGASPALAEDPFAQPSAEKAAPLVPIQRQRRAAPAERLLDQELTPPEGAKPLGRPISLVQLLAQPRVRTARLDAVRAYWQCSAALCEYYVCLREFQRLAAWVEGHPPATAATEEHEPTARSKADALTGERSDEATTLESSALQAARAAAQARVTSAWLDLHQAAGRLAEWAGSSEPLVSSDLPHCGTYRTEFPRVFAARPPTPRMAWLNQAIPAYLEAIELRAQAVQAAADALDAASSARGSSPDCTALLARAAEDRRQRLALLAAVRSYNEAIAEYALAIAGDGLDAPRIAAMLIKSSDGRNSRQQAPLQAPHDAGGLPLKPVVPPVERHDRAAVPAPGGSTPLRPTPALPPEQAAQEVGPVIPATALVPHDSTGESSPQPAEGTPTPASAASDGAPRKSSPQGSAPPLRSILRARESQPKLHSAQRPVGEADEPRDGTAPGDDVAERAAASQQNAHSGEHGGDNRASGELAALADAPPDRQASVLASVLYWDRLAARPADSTPLALFEALERSPATHRLAIIDAYWNAREALARTQFWREQGAYLAELWLEVLENRSRLSGPQDLLDLRAFRSAARADEQLASVQFLHHQFVLAQMIQSPSGAAAPWPSSQPIAAPFELDREAGPPLRALASEIPHRWALASQLATSIVLAEKDQAAALERYRREDVPLWNTLWAMRQTSQQMVLFLRSIQRYNQVVGACVCSLYRPAEQAELLGSH